MFQGLNEQGCNTEQPDARHDRQAAQVGAPDCHNGNWLAAAAALAWLSSVDLSPHAGASPLLFHRTRSMTNSTSTNPTTTRGSRRAAV